MRYGIFSDTHITKKLPTIQSEWEDSIISTFESMYTTFKENDIKEVFCLGDFFDKPVLEARHVNLVNTIVKILSESGIFTYFLLGNHEIESDEHNILECLSKMHAPIEIISKPSYNEGAGGIFCIPYNYKLEDIPPEEIEGRILFTHHDIYGSELAGGKVKASFGTDPNILSSARAVFNGHVHLRSKFGNVTNVGSLFTTQFGELKEGDLTDKPKYYILDTKTLELTEFVNEHSINYVTTTVDSLPRVLESYGTKMLRIEYEGDMPTDLVLDDKVLKTFYKKKLSKSLEDSSDKDEVVASTLDMHQLIDSYVNKDETLSQESKKEILDKIVTVIGEYK